MHVKLVNEVTAYLICALIKICMMSNISHIYTMYNPQVGRSVRKIGFIPEVITPERPVDGKASIVGCFRMDDEALKRVEKLSGVTCEITASDLPLILAERVSKDEFAEKKVAAYV